MDWLSISMLHKLNTLWERGVVATACNKVGLIPPRWGGWSRIIFPLSKNNKTECTFVLNIQLAKLAGNKVVATCGGESKSTFLSSLGVDRVVNYRNENLKDVSFCFRFLYLPFILQLDNISLVSCANISMSYLLVVSTYQVAG